MKKNELTKTTATATKTTKTNATKTNAKYNDLYTELLTATCKRDLVDTMNKYGYRTTTIPTTTPNVNDLYVQFSDKSRLLITKQSLKVYTNNDHATALNKVDNKFYFDNVNDGSYRTKRSTVANTLENFTTIFEYYFKNGCIDLLPTK